MKGLYNFQEFNFEKFSRNIDFLFCGAETWTSYENKDEVLGTRVNLIIINDSEGRYGDKGYTNNGEKFTVKIPNKSPESDFAKIDLMQKVEVVNPSKCSVWGEHSNNLSITAENVRPVK